MANRISGSTDISGALGVLPRNTMTVFVVGARGTGFTAVEETIFNITGTADAASKWGDDAEAVKLISILIQNGVSSIKGIMTKEVGVDPAPTTKAEAYDSALDKLLVDNSMGVIICDETDATVHAAIKTHLNLAEGEDIFRYGCVGLEAGQTNEQFATAVGLINDKRIFVPGPNTVDASAVAQSGIYAAAGLAALIAVETIDPALPMNGVEMVGFGGVERVLLKAEKDALVTAGIVPLYTNASGNPTVHRLVTTYTKNSEAVSDPTWKEGTTIFIADDVLLSVETRLKLKYPRTKNVTRILKSIRTDVIDILQTKNGLEIIENFDPNTVTVQKDPMDVYGALIDYIFDVVTPLYTLTIRQHMKL